MVFYCKIICVCVMWLCLKHIHACMHDILMDILALKLLRFNKYILILYILVITQQYVCTTVGMVSRGGFHHMSIGDSVHVGICMHQQ